MFCFLLKRFDFSHYGIRPEIRAFSVPKLNAGFARFVNFTSPDIGNPSPQIRNIFELK